MPAPGDDGERDRGEAGAVTPLRAPAGALLLADSGRVSSATPGVERLLTPHVALALDETQSSAPAPTSRPRWGGASVARVAA